MNSIIKALTELQCILLFAAIFVSPLHAAFENTTTGARPTAMAGAFVGLADSPDALFYNPAGIANLGYFSSSVFYTRPYQLKELDMATGAAVLPFTSYVLGLAYKRFGRTPYQEHTAYISGATTIAARVQAGVTVKFFHLGIEKYGSASTFGIDIGFLAKLTRVIKWGVCAQNINRPTIGDCREQLPLFYATGISYTPHSKFIVSLDVSKDVRYDPSLHFGASFTPLPYTALRLGVQNAPSRISFGAGLIVGRLQIDYAVRTHIDLGVSHCFSITFYSR